MAAAHRATGDLKNSLMKLLREIQRMKLSVEPNVQGLCLGAPSSLLPVLHHCLMHYSLPLASWLSKHDYELYGKSDLRFVEGVYKVLREVFHYHPCLTKQQFLTVGYAERKLQLATDLLRACQAKHRELVGSKQTRRGRGTTRKIYCSSEDAQRSKSEVLTIQSTSGISSAWTEPIATRVEGPNDEENDNLPHFSPLSSPEHSLGTVTPTRNLEFTPSPTPDHHPHTTLPLHSSPNSLSTHPQPVVVRHSTLTAQGLRVMSERVLGGVNVQSGGPLDGVASGTAPWETLAIENLLSSSEYGSGEVESKGEWEGEPEGPPGEGNLHRGGDHEETRPPKPQTLTGDLPPNEQAVLVEVNERVQQLARMVERMAARFVLLETRLKTVQPGLGTLQPGLGTVQPGLGTLQPGLGTVQGVASREQQPGLEELRPQQEEEEEEEEEERQTVAHSRTPTNRDDRSVTGTHGERVRGESNHRDVSSVPPEKGRTPLVIAVTAETVSMAMAPIVSVATTTYGSSTNTLRGTTALSSQLARLRAEHHLPPLSPLHTPSHHHSHTHTPKTPHHRITTGTPLPPPSTPLPPPSTPLPPPSTPEDTRRMIASLRDRAQRTKDFLQKANNRV